MRRGGVNAPADVPSLSWLFSAGGIPVHRHNEVLGILCDAFRAAHAVLELNAAYADPLCLLAWGTGASERIVLRRLCDKAAGGLGNTLCPHTLEGAGEIPLGPHAHLPLLMWLQAERELAREGIRDVLAFCSPEAELIGADLPSVQAFLHRHDPAPLLLERFAAGGEALGLDRSLYAVALEHTDGEDFFF